MRNNRENFLNEKKDNMLQSTRKGETNGGEGEVRGMTRDVKTERIKKAQKDDKKKRG